MPCLRCIKVEILGLLLGLILPWLLGVVWLRVRWIKAGNITWPTLLGYGYLAGLLITTLVMRLLDLLGYQLGFVNISLLLLLLIAAGVWAGYGTPLRLKDIGSDWAGLNGWYKAAYTALFLLIVIRLVVLGLEVAWRPLFPWDTWASWAPMSRVWYELGHLAPFYAPEDQWLAGLRPGEYIDGAWGHPPTIPLIQVWMSYSMGRWDDSLMNLPWLLCAIALGLAFYGQARQWQIPPLFAMMFTYFLLTLPFLNAHVALAGYADIFMGVFYGLAAMAFFHWSRTRDIWQGSVALLFALACAFIKQSGVFWMLTFLPALWVVLMPRAGLIGVALLAGVGTLFVVLGRVTNINLFGYSFSVHYRSAWEPFWQNTLILDNWHLLWYLLGLALVLSIPRLLVHSLRGMTVLVLTSFSFLVGVFFFTETQEYAENYTTLSRTLLHASIMLMFYIMVLFQEAVSMPGFMTAQRN